MRSRQPGWDSLETINPGRWFLPACAFELALLAVALAVGKAANLWPFANFGWTLQAGVIGMVAALPPFLLFWSALRAKTGPMVQIRGFLESVVRPVFASWSITQLAVISLLAGVCEESLFRGVVQAGVERAFGPGPALVFASLLFGLCHFVNLAYALVAALLGFYLGLLWQLTGNLLTPITTHAVYDFAALVWFLRVHRRG